MSSEIKAFVIHCTEKCCKVLWENHKVIHRISKQNHLKRRCKFMQYGEKRKPKIRVEALKTILLTLEAGKAGKTNTKQPQKNKTEFGLQGCEGRARSASRKSRRGNLSIHVVEHDFVTTQLYCKHKSVKRETGRGVSNLNNCQWRTNKAHDHFSGPPRTQEAYRDTECLSDL